MNNKRNILLSVTVLLWVSLACQSLAPSEDPASIEAETVATETEEESSPLVPTESSDTEEESAQTGSVYDGSWVGTNTVDDKEILFTVENNEVTSVSLNYTGESNGCDYHGAISAGSATGSLDEAVITNDAFAVSYESVNDELTFTGTFTSESQASGTLLIKSSAEGLCGAYEKEVSWTASKGSSADAEPTEDTSGLASQDGDAVLTQFFDAVNAGDLDSALEMVDDNVMFSFGAQGAQFGRDNLEAYLQSAQGVTYQISDAESLGGTMVQFTATTSDGTTYSFCNIILQEGKIVSLSLQP